MTKLQKRAIQRVIEIVNEGQQEMIDVAISKEDDKTIATEMKGTSTTGTRGNRIYGKFTDAERWLNDILGD